MKLLRLRPWVDRAKLLGGIDGHWAALGSTHQVREFGFREDWAGEFVHAGGGFGSRQTDYFFAYYLSLRSVSSPGLVKRPHR